MTTKHFIAKDICVDAGLIMIFDKDYINQYGFREDNSIDGGKEMNIDPGTWRCYWDIEETYNGPVDGHGILEVTSGKVLIIDPCYVLEDWDKWLKDTDCGCIVPDGTLILDSMGGDGTYEVVLRLELINAKKVVNG